MTKPEFENVFLRLKAILKENEPELILKFDTPDNYYLNTRIHPTKPREEGFFAAVQIKKNYVSYHLFPVYLYPEFLNEISAELKKRMQGKACFNFKKADESLFHELQRLTKNGFAKMKENNLI